MIPVLKIFGSAFWHDTVTIVGNKESLIRLRNLIDRSLKEGYDLDEFMETDGEGYNVEIKLHDEDFGSSEWDGLPMHYTDDKMIGSNSEKEWKNLHKLLIKDKRENKIEKINQGEN